MSQLWLTITNDNLILHDTFSKLISTNDDFDLNFKKMEENLNFQKMKTRCSSLKISHFSNFLNFLDSDGLTILERMIEYICSTETGSLHNEQKLVKICAKLLSNPFLYFGNKYKKSYDLLCNYFENSSRIIQILIDEMMQLKQKTKVIKIYKYIKDENNSLKKYLADKTKFTPSITNNEFTSPFRKYMIEEIDKYTKNLNNINRDEYKIFDSLADLVDLHERGVCTSLAYFNQKWYIATNAGTLNDEGYNRKIIESEIIERFKIIIGNITKDGADKREVWDLILDEIPFEYFNGDFTKVAADKKKVWNLILDEIITKNTVYEFLNSCYANLKIKDTRYHKNDSRCTLNEMSYVSEDGKDFIFRAIEKIVEIEEKLKNFKTEYNHLAHGEIKENGTQNPDGIHAEVLVAREIFLDYSKMAINNKKNKCYIGISKPSCHLCTFTISLYNNQMQGLRFVTQNPCINKNQHNWPVPDFFKDIVPKDFQNVANFKSLISEINMSEKPLIVREDSTTSNFNFNNEESDDQNQMIESDACFDRIKELNKKRIKAKRKKTKMRVSKRNVSNNNDEYDDDDDDDDDEECLNKKRKKYT